MGSGQIGHWDRVAALQAMGAMGAQGDRANLPELLAVLDGDKECWHTRTAAIGALVALGAEEAGPAILKLLARDRDPDTREAAIQALGRLRCQRARRLLERIKAEDPSPALREEAARALALLR